MWRWRWNGKWRDVNGGKRWDVIEDLDGVRSVDGMDGDGIEALRMGCRGGKVVLAAVRGKRQWLRLTRRRWRSTRWSRW